MKMIVIVALFFIVAVSVLGWVWISKTQFGSTPAKEEWIRYRLSSHFTEKSATFINDQPEPKAMVADPWGLIKEWLFGPEIRSPRGPIPSHSPDLQAFLKNESDKPQWIWLGHSTFYLNFGKRLILVDPVLGVASPLPFLVKRFSKPLLTLRDLPKPDVIVLSHDHYDHLDANVMREIGTWDDQPQFMVPLGVGKRLVSWGIKVEKIHELDWGESRAIDGVTFTSTPAQHFSGRGLTDRNKTLWSGWLMTHESFKIYYSGDGGYGPHFKKIGDTYGPIDLAFLECGQYNVSWRYVHMLPEEVIQAAHDVKARSISPVHWGMFVLALHDWMEPIETVTALAEKEGLATWHPELGELVRWGTSAIPKAWWREHPDFSARKTSQIK